MKVISRIKLIKTSKTKVEFGKALMDSDKGLAREYKGMPLPYLSKHLHTFDVKLEHLKFDSKGKGLMFIDMNARTSIDPVLAEKFDTEKMNRLDYLSESAFWDSMNLRKRDIVELLITMGCGIGLYSILRLVLSMYGYSLP